MTKFMTSLLAGSAFFGLPAVVHAADLGGSFRAPQVIGTMSDPAPSSSGWYLRGDVGVGAYTNPSFNSDGSEGLSTLGGSWLRKEIGDSTNISAGVGYQFTDYLRGDLTAEYRTVTRFRGDATLPDRASATGSNMYVYYDGNVRAIDVMANGYVDLGNYYGLTPYVGAGIGAAYVSLGDTYAHTTWPEYGTLVDGVLPGNSKTNFAWALHTGVSWDVNPRLKLEMGYSYKNLGDIKSKELRCNYAGGVAANCNEWLTVKSLASNDLHIGMRWLLDPKEAKAPAYTPAPIVAKY